MINAKRDLTTAPQKEPHALDDCKNCNSMRIATSYLGDHEWQARKLVTALATGFVIGVTIVSGGIAAALVIAALNYFVGAS